MKEIYHCFDIKVPLYKVFQALTEKKGLAGWWTKNLDHQGTVGSISTFRFKSGAFNKIKIIKVEPCCIEWLCLDGHDEWKGTRLIFQLQDHGQHSEVCFAHFGFKEQTPYVGACSFMWASYFMSLQKYGETGHGNPDPGKQEK